MIVKNEEETLSRCLDSIKDIADEIVIIDTGSTDKTKEIAKLYTNLIYDFEWVFDFSKARNYSFSKATKDYIMWLDADDVILAEDQVKLLELKRNFNTEVDTLLMKYSLTNKDSQNIVCSFYRERIVKRSKNFQWNDPVHEYILYSGKFMKSDIAVTHIKMHQATRRNLEIFETYIENGNELSERNWFYYARELFKVGEIEKASKYYKDFLDTTSGLLSNYLDSCIELSSYYDHKKDDSNSLKTLIKYFEKDGPRAEICCKLGYYYKERGDYEKALSWFTIAPNTIKPVSLGAIMPHYWTYVPYMEMCVCSYKIGDIDSAIKYNEMAAELYPKDDIILHNRFHLALVKQQLVAKEKEKLELK